MLALHCNTVLLILSVNKLNPACLPSAMAKDGSADQRDWSNPRARAICLWEEQEEQKLICNTTHQPRYTCLNIAAVLACNLSCWLFWFIVACDISAAQVCNVLPAPVSSSAVIKTIISAKHARCWTCIPIQINLSFLASYNTPGSKLAVKLNAMIKTQRTVLFKVAVLSH